MAACMGAASVIHFSFARQLRVTQENEEHFRLLYEEAPLAYQSLDQNGCLIEANEAWLEMLGHLKKDVIGKNLGEFLTPHSQELFRQRFLRFKTLGETAGVEFDLVRKDGSVLATSVDGRVAHDEKGNFKQTHCILHNITPLKLANERLTLAFEAANDGLWDWDIASGVVYFSPRWYTMLGYDYQEFPATYEAWAELLHPDIREDVEKRIHDHVEAGSPFEEEFMMKCKDGSYKKILSRGKIVEKRGEKTKRMIGTHMDVSVVRKMEEEHEQFILQAKEEWERTFDAVPDLIAILDRDHHIVRVNKAMAEAVGIPQMECSGKLCFECVHGTDAPPVACPHEKMLLSKQTETADALEEKLGGEFSITVSPLLDDEGELIGSVHVAHDITDRRRSEHEREQLISDLEASNRELKRFAYVASHDLQEPLRMVTSFLQLLLKKYQGDLDEEAHEFIDFAVDGAKRMQELISSLLDYSRIGTQEQDFQFIQSKDIFERAVTNLKSAIEECEGEITCQCCQEEGCLPKIYGDPTQLLQLFQNIIGNAIKYHKKGVPPKIQVSYEDKGDDLLFSIADNGVGIEEEYLEKIFGVFQRLYSRDEYSGTGIGLAICKRVIQRHGGQIWAESELGKGSTFYFSIPKPKYPKQGETP